MKTATATRNPVASRLIPSSTAAATISPTAFETKAISDAHEQTDHVLSQVKTTESADRSTGPWCTASTFVPSGSKTYAP